LYVFVCAVYLAAHFIIHNVVCKIEPVSWLNEALDKNWCVLCHDAVVQCWANRDRRTMIEFYFALPQSTQLINIKLRNKVSDVS
jgi:hypothetical protein